MSDAEIETLLSQLTLAEKSSLIVGLTTWQTAPVERLRIPHVKVSDGPSGARGEIFGENVPAAFIPCGVSLGATWDEGLMFRVGEILAEETKSKSASVLLAPTMCIHRHPLGGRNFESFSEDPFLSGRMASAHIRGLQSRGIGATPKHFVANDQETKRFHVDAVISPRALREVYLLPFQMAVRDANPWCMMTAYNKVNGNHVDMSKGLLTDVARGEWGWDGLFMSDWGGTNSCVESIRAGLDLEMPGPPNRRLPGILEAALEDGKLVHQDIDNCARRVLKMIYRTGRFHLRRDHPETTLTNPETSKLLLDAAAAGIVMLKNEQNALPLRQSEKLGKVAIVGPNAARVVAGGGGSSYINAPYWTTVLGSLQDKLQANGTEVLHSIGAKVNRFVTVLDPDLTTNPATGGRGGILEWHHGHDFDSPIVARQNIEDFYYISFGNTPPEILQDIFFSFRLRTVLRPITTGKHQISIASVGSSKTYINGELVAEIEDDFDNKGPLFVTFGSQERVLVLNLDGGRDYEVRIDCLSHDRQQREDLIERLDPMERKFQGVRIGYSEQDSRDLPAEAAAIAKHCDAAIVVVGRDREWETEGEDVPVFELPGEQVRLIEEVAATCKRTIVVIQAGTPVAFQPWIYKVQGVLYAWYQGQELGNAAAAIICGKVNPSGRLPITMPRRLQDCPAFSSFPGEDLVSRYSEDIYVGYKWWDLLDIVPQFPIGFGLSYNEFDITECSLDCKVLRRDAQITLRVKVSHVGQSTFAGKQTVIVWQSQRSPRRLSRPTRQICGFEKTPKIKPGLTVTVSILIDAYGLGMYDPRKGAWVIDEGSKFDISIGSNASETTIVGSIEVPDEITWIHRL